MNTVLLTRIMLKQWYKLLIIKVTNNILGTILFPPPLGEEIK
jgi:hypothetical protein